MIKQIGLPLRGLPILLITRMITERIGLHSVLLPLLIALIDKFLLTAPYVTARDCAVIAGHVMSMSPVLGNLTRLKTRFLHKVIESRRSWDSRFNIELHIHCLSDF